MINDPTDEVKPLVQAVAQICRYIGARLRPDGKPGEQVGAGLVRVVSDLKRQASGEGPRPGTAS